MHNCGGKDPSAAKGIARENFVAKLVDGQATGGKQVTAKEVGNTDIDVTGPNGELIAVGGPAKAFKPDKLGKQLKVLKALAEERGVKAMAYFDEDTPESVLKIARRQLGAENVFVVKMN